MAANHVHDRYLDAEERYEVFVVKAAERPHLVHWTAVDSGEDPSEEKKADDSSVHPSAEPPPPLTDGCDLPGWRRERVAPCMNALECGREVDVESPLQGTLHVGAGSSLLRRESQLPFVSSGLCSGRANNNPCWWHSAKESFGVPPPEDRAAPVIDHGEAVKLVDGMTFFCKEYEMKNRPVKVLGATEGWKAMPSYGTRDDAAQDPTAVVAGKERNSWRDVGETSAILSGGGRGGWTFANLLSRFGNISFRFSDTHGEMLSILTYAKYITSPEGLSDDSPLGIYDSEFGDADSPTSVLLDEYSVPSCFSPDLFDLADDGAASDDDTDEEDDHTPKISRPPYRWILIGPERSGTGMHVDPLMTNAWVTILQGKKRWLLFPPDTPHESIGMHDDEPQIPSSIWFRDYYDKVTLPTWPKRYRPVEVLQCPGETVYVPAGWPHLVLNLALTVAVTHNYASEHGPFFERLCAEVAQDEAEFASRWHDGLQRCGRGDLLDGTTKSG
ncbi:hypothetical protein ACHAXT_012068 [Thalassiosira profunda]